MNRGWDMGAADDPLTPSLARVRAGRNPERRDLGNPKNDATAPDDAMTDPRVQAILDRFHNTVRDAATETFDAFADLAEADPTLRLPPRR